MERLLRKLLHFANRDKQFTFGEVRQELRLDPGSKEYYRTKEAWKKLVSDDWIEEIKDQRRTRNRYFRVKRDSVERIRSAVTPVGNEGPNATAARADGKSPIARLESSLDVLRSHLDEIKGSMDDISSKLDELAGTVSRLEAMWS